MTKKRRSKLNVLPSNPEKEGSGRFPSWLHRSLPKGAALAKTAEMIGEGRLHTVCEEARCPNRLECWSKRQAAFLAMGRHCTRSCGFCSIDFSKAPPKLDPDEPERLANLARAMELRHIVVTMVARDDLEDGGAGHLIAIIEKLRSELVEVTIELLTSDFNGNWKALEAVLAAKPEIFNHNIETVRELTPRVRHRATYARSLELLAIASAFPGKNYRVKSGLMVGLGESEAQVFEAIDDLYRAGCDLITIGQYLQPTSQKLRVKSFIPPEQFQRYEAYGRKIGVKGMFCGPFVRSSYHAEELLK